MMPSPGRAGTQVSPKSFGLSPRYNTYVMYLNRKLTVEEFDALPQEGSINPRVIRFTQNTAGIRFKNGILVSKTARCLANGTVNPNNPGLRIKIVKSNGLIYSLDNRRLAAFQKSGVPIRYIKLDHIPKRELFKFTSANKGAGINLIPPRNLRNLKR